jgi:hypothetical protein
LQKEIQSIRKQLQNLGEDKAKNEKLLNQLNAELDTALKVFQKVIRRKNVRLARNKNRVSFENRHIRQGRRPGFVYLFWVEAFGLYKIGRSKNPQKRAENFFQAVPDFVKCEIVHVIKTDDKNKLEVWLHDTLSDYNQSNEWFDLNHFQVELLKQIESVIFTRRASVNQLRSRYSDLVAGEPVF